MPVDNKAELEAATQFNTALVQQVTRWKRVRGSVAGTLLVIGLALVYVKSFYAPPFILAAGVAFLLYLAARDQLREVKARRWKSPTPRVSKFTPSSPSTAGTKAVPTNPPR
jgi:threonine/homoserine/homoserine lactone efflux protein